MKSGRARVSTRIFAIETAGTLGTVQHVDPDGSTVDIDFATWGRLRAQLQLQLELTQGNLNALAGDNLKRSPIEATGDISAHSTHMADQGTDNFDRELALNLASSRQDSLYDIEDAIRRVDDGSYGACESCGCAIERPRLKALPFAKKCMACQNAAERGRTKYRPFGGTLPLQQLAAEDANADSPDSMG